MIRTLTIDAVHEIGQTVSVSGWVHARRDHGGLIFIDLRDHKGLLQLVINPEATEAFAIAEDVRDEFVVRVSGMVRERSLELKNDNIATGGVELAAEEIIILNKSETLPIQPFSEAQAGEELRLKYRYLDMRRPKMQEIMRRRAQYYKVIRDYMEEREFIEVTTPIIANSSPEGARDFLIPSRLQEGKFYALPQAPQQFKQLLMVGGIPRYYQIAACFRDEDPRADRLYGEFYQLDLEMSFVEDGEEVRNTMEPLIKSLVTGFASKKLLSETIPRITHADAIETYGSDKPDLRYDMKLINLTNIFMNSEFGVFKNATTDGKVVKAICVKNGGSLSRKQIDYFTAIAKSEGAGGLAYITYEDGEVKSPIAKFLSVEELDAIKRETGAEDGDAVFFGADLRSLVNKVLGRLRNEFAVHFKLKDPTIVALAWIVDFPFYEWNESTNKLDFGHNPFSMPRGGSEVLDNVEDKLSIVADQYDMVMNGYEICSGGVRNHNPDVLYKVFGILGYDKQYVEDKFGAMLNAFKFGAPPHAGCAFGVDRILMELLDESNVREVVAFPKNGSGVDLMMNSPSFVDSKQLKELGL
ncbi:MAG: aspartate--tRNA ligase [Candidatus Saccharimonadales bacterium]